MLAGMGVLWAILTLFCASASAAPEREDAAEGDGAFSVPIQRHERNYFISGSPNTKARFSFKFPLKSGSGHYLGYSQLMLWRLFQETSSPMEDVNFNPEYFYRWRLKGNRLPFFDLGVEHLSNGQSRDTDSRSWNSVYAHFPWSMPVGEEGRFNVGWKPFLLWDVEAYNPDAREWVGWYELEFSVTGVLANWIPYDELYFHLRPGGKEGNRLERSYMEFGARFKVFRGRTAPLGFMQYFVGYGESQLTYDKKTHGLRVGVSI